MRRCRGQQICSLWILRETTLLFWGSRMMCLCKSLLPCWTLRAFLGLSIRWQAVCWCGFPWSRWSGCCEFFCCCSLLWFDIRRSKGGSLWLLAGAGDTLCCWGCWLFWRSPLWWWFSWWGGRSGFHWFFSCWTLPFKFLFWLIALTDYSLTHPPHQ